MPRRKLGFGIVAVAGLAAVTVAMASGSGNSRPEARSAAPTWSDVAPIFADKCVGCHTPGGIAPFSLRNARTARAYADGILVMTKLGRMPPWMPGHDSPAYLGQSKRLLTPAEKQLIARWVQGGARIGNGTRIKSVGAVSNAPGTTITLIPPHSYMPKAAIGGLESVVATSQLPHPMAVVCQDLELVNVVVVECE